MQVVNTQLKTRLQQHVHYVSSTMVYSYPGISHVSLGSDYCMSDCNIKGQREVYISICVDVIIIVIVLQLSLNRNMFPVM